MIPPKMDSLGFLFTLAIVGAFTCAGMAVWLAVHLAFALIQYVF